MKKLVFLSVFAVILGLVSCSKESKEINSYDDAARGLVVAGANHTELKIIDALTGSVSTEDVFLSANGKSLNSEIVRIAEYRDVLYIFQPEEYRIVAISAIDFKQIAIIDFSSKGYKPLDICFANATDSYIVFSNAAKVCLMDLTNYAIAREIDLPANANSITVSGNQVFLACTAANKISVIDTRTNQRTHDLNTDANPLYVGVRYNGKECVAISAGTGKIDTNETKTAAACNYYDVDTKANTGRVEVGSTAAPATKFYPKGLVVTSKDWAFVPGQTHFLRADIKGKKRVSVIGKYVYNSIYYDIVRGEIIAIKELNGVLNADFCDPTTGSKKRTITLPNNTSVYHPLKG